MAFNLATFGNCQLTDNQGEPVRVPALAIVALVYLYYEGRPVLRRDLASILWGGELHVALTNLRSTLRRFAKALPASGSTILEQNDQYVSVNRNMLACDLEVTERSDPFERLKGLCDGLSKGFLPSYGSGNRPVDRWVCDFRLMLAEAIRSDFMLLSSSPIDSERHSLLKRAGILLLDEDPHDDEVRISLSALSETASLRASRVPASVSGDPQPLASASTPLPRVALLPPVSAGQMGKQSDIANTLVEDLTIGLCTSKSVSVVAPYTCEKITASKDKASLLKKHNVNYALDTKKTEGGLFAQLIFMPTDEIVWAGRFDLDAYSSSKQRSIVYKAIHDTVVERVNSYSSYLDEFNENPDAYLSYLQGLQSMNSLTLPSIRRARKHFKEALRQKNRLPSALAGLSRTLSMEWVLTTRGDTELLNEAERLARLAIAEDRMAAGAFKELGVSQLYLGKIDESIDALHEAEVLSPHYADVLCSYSDSLTHGGKPELALSKVEAAIALNPVAPDTYLWTAAGANYFVGNYCEAIDLIDQMRDKNSVSRLAAACWGMLGDSAKARACRNRFFRDNPDFDLESWLSMIPIKQHWQTEHYREGLLKAGF